MRKNLLALLFLALPLAGCKLPIVPGAVDDTLRLKEARFADLPGWNADAQAETLGALRKSCARIAKKNPESDFGVGGFAGTSAAWQGPCSVLPPAGATNEAARAFFETYFTPYSMTGAKGADGLFTGYYEPTLRGAPVRGGAYQTPIYGRPADLVTVDLGKFKDAWKGESIAGRVDASKSLVPYHTRADIEKGALANDKLEIVWVDDPVDAFFLHVQGSGRVVMEDGRVLRVGYAAQNGRPYTAIGKKLIENGALAKDNVSMQTIRAWLEANPAQAAEMMNINLSYVFFRVLDGADTGPLGAEGVPLTPRRSLAVDRKKVPYGVPVFLDAAEPEGGARLQRLMVAQDTGGAIVGAVRGDFFWGPGDEAAHKAGLMKSPGRAWVLLPKTIKIQ